MALRDSYAEALSTVIDLKDARAVPRFVAALDAKDGDPPLAMIVAAIGKLGDRAAVPPLSSWFHRRNRRESERVYREVADALIRLADAGVVDLLERALARAAINDYQRWAYENALDGIRHGKGPGHSLWLP